jgi:hypothetical protein
VRRSLLVRHAADIEGSRRLMRPRRGRATTGSNRHPDDENTAAQRRARQFRTRFLANDRRRVRRALEPDYRDRLRAGRYGISLKEFRALEARQDHVCAICLRPARILCIDHCHVTGRVRGLLCHKCNSVLGFCNDDPGLLRAAMAYLLRTAKKRGADERQAASAVRSTDVARASPPGAS